MRPSRYIWSDRVCSIGRNIKFLINRPDEDHFFRLHEERVYYIRSCPPPSTWTPAHPQPCSSESAMRLCTNVQRDNLMSLGTCFGKFTHSRKIHANDTGFTKMCISQTQTANKVSHIMHARSCKISLRKPMIGFCTATLQVPYAHT